VLVTDSWLANAGDAAISLATDRLIRDVAPGATVLHAAYQFDLLGDRYPELAVVPPLSTLLGVEFASAPPPEWTGDRGPALVEAADLIVSQGGGFLMEHYQPWERLHALARVVELGRPLVLLGQGISAFRLARARALMRFIVRGAVAVAVRDTHSHGHVVELGADPERVVLTSDLGLLLVEQLAEPRSAVNEGVGLVLTTHGLEDRHENEREAIVHQLLTEVIERTPGETVTLASTVSGLSAKGFEDDTPTAHAAVAPLSAADRRRVDVVEGYLSPQEAIRRFGACRAVVSQRFHPVVFALAQGVPAALMLAGDKAASLDGLDVERLVCRAPDDESARRQTLDYALGSAAPCGSELIERLQPAFDRARRNVDVIREALAAVAAPSP
jgi:hypothetical protein